MGPVLGREMLTSWTKLNFINWDSKSHSLTHWSLNKIPDIFICICWIKNITFYGTFFPKNATLIHVFTSRRIEYVKSHCLTQRRLNRMVSIGLMHSPRNRLYTAIIGIISLYVISCICHESAKHFNDIQMNTKLVIPVVMFDCYTPYY